MSIEIIMFGIVLIILFVSSAVFGFYQRKWIDERFD